MRCKLDDELIDDLTIRDVCGIVLLKGSLWEREFAQNILGSEDVSFKQILHLMKFYYS